MKNTTIKKLLSLFLAIAIMVCVVPFGAFTLTARAESEEYTEGYYTYTVSNSEATIADCDESISGDVNIPSKLGGYPVTSIGNSAFYRCWKLTSITVPENVKSIGDWAFRDCESLTSITIPNSVTIIGYEAFSWCESLTNITIPNSVATIGGYAFYGCFNLTSITIPNSVTTIGDGAFSDCARLQNIEIDDGNEYFNDVNGVLFNKDKTSILCYPAGKASTSYTIPNSVTTICGSAFSHCRNLTSITIPNSVTTIGDGAFSYCYNLTSVSLGNSVTSICYEAFSFCLSLTSITIPNSVTSIGDSAFYYCNSLENVYYRGSETDKEKISIDAGNDYLTNATWYYDICAGTEVHDYADATCTAPKTCSVCGATSGDALGHVCTTLNADDEYHWFECDRCHEFKEFVQKHEYTVPMFDDENHWDECECVFHKIANVEKHKFDNACDETCDCGYVRTVGAHKYNSGKITTKPTCTKTGVKTYTCTECGKKKTESVAKVAHSYASATCTKAKTCKVCGVTSGKALGHTYKTTTTKATLSKNGKVVKKCKVCSKVASTTTIKYAKSFKLSTTSYTYNGKVKTPGVIVKDSAGKTLKKNTDYTVSYASGRKNVGTYRVTVKMKGKYSGTKYLYFKINPVGTKVSKLTAGKKSIIVNISKKSTQISGYQVQYSTSKKFKSAKTKTISSYKTTKYTLKSLSAKKTYYVRVRTYKTVGGKKYYSNWSSYKYIKTK